MTRFISMQQLRDKVGLSKTAIYARIKSGTFPRSVPLGPKRVVFVEAEIESWMRTQVKRGRKGTKGLQERSERSTRAVKAVQSRRERRTAA